MSVLEFLDSSVFTPVYQNDVPLINCPRVDAICKELQFAIQNGEEIFIYGDYDVDGLSAMMVWKEQLSLMRAAPPVLFRYVARTHMLDRDIIRQVQNTKARVVIICDTGSSLADRHILNMLQMQGYTTIVIDHHVFVGDYAIECNNRLTFNAYEERSFLGNCEVSGAYASLLVAKVLCEKYMNCPLAFNAKVYALCSMYSDCVDMSSPIARALYNSVAVANAQGPLLFNKLNAWDYLYGRRFFSYIVAPKLNGCFRMERLDILNRIFSATDRFQMQGVVEDLQEIHTEASSLTKAFVPEFERVRIGDIVLCTHIVTEETRLLHVRNFTGVIATQIANEEKAAVIVVVKDNRHYSGSFRDYYGRALLETFSLFSDCAGHPPAFKVEFSDLEEFKKHLHLLASQLNVEYEKPYLILNSGVIEGDEDINALALYNEYMNMKPGVVIAHRCSNTHLSRGTQFNKYYTVGLPTEKLLMTKRTLIDGASVLIEPAICRGVELRERE